VSSGGPALRLPATSAARHALGRPAGQSVGPPAASPASPWPRCSPAQAP
jgi:hypothetical protein